MDLVTSGINFGSHPPVDTRPDRVEQRNTTQNASLKIVAFTDINYVPIAKKWFDRLVELGYRRDEVVIACNDRESYNALHAENYTVEECFIVEPDRKRLEMGLMRQLMMERLKYAVRQLQMGTSLLVTDVDNIFMRHVPLEEFYKEPFDVIHANEMKFPVPYVPRPNCVLDSSFSNICDAESLVDKDLLCALGISSSKLRS